MSVASIFRVFVGTSLAVIGSLRFAFRTSWHTLPVFTVLSMIRGQYTDYCVQSFTLYLRPGALSCAISEISICFPLMDTVFDAKFSERAKINEPRSTGRYIILSGLPGTQRWPTRNSSRCSCCFVGLKFTRSSDVFSVV